MIDRPLPPANCALLSPGAAPTTAVAVWTGELLWPSDLPDAAVIECSGVRALGCWVHAWLRARPLRAVVGGEPALRARLHRAGVPVRWFASVAEALAANPADLGGVSADEREMLWS